MLPELFNQDEENISHTDMEQDVDQPVDIGPRGFQEQDDSNDGDHEDNENNAYDELFGINDRMKWKLIIAKI